MYAWPITHVFVLAAVLGANATAGRRTGAVSARYDTPFTPARGAFAVWGLIYTLLTATIVAQFFDAPLARALALPLLFQAALNIAWIVLFTRERVRVAAIALFGIAASVGVCYARVRALDDATLWPRAIARATFSIYLGWVCLASVLNTWIALGGPARVYPPARDRAMRATVWTIIFAASALVQWFATDPLLTLPIAWGAAFRARRGAGDGVAGAFGALLVATSIATLARR